MTVALAALCVKFLHVFCAFFGVCKRSVGIRIPGRQLFGFQMQHLLELVEVFLSFLDQIHALDQNPLTGLGGDTLSSDDARLLRSLYAAEVAYADSILQRILDRLRQSERLDHTVVVVTADHGENLDGHVPLDHQLGLYDTLVHVPLLIRYPASVPAGSTEDRLVSLASVPRRMLQLAGALPGSDDDGASPAKRPEMTREERHTAWQSLSEEEKQAKREKMRAKREQRRAEWEALSPEEREAKRAEMRRRMEAMTPEEREAMKQRRQHRGQRGDKSEHHSGKKDESD